MIDPTQNDLQNTMPILMTGCGPTGSATGPGPVPSDTTAAARRRSGRFTRLYSSPFIHAPALCPFDPPAALFADDYDPAREPAAWRHCFASCPALADDSRRCLQRYGMARRSDRALDVEDDKVDRRAREVAA
jgi:hypothetical protein